MKKLLLIMAAVVLAGTSANAQGSKEVKELKSYLAVHAGPSFPLGNFNSTNMDNEDAGFAKTGYTINMNYGYQVQQVAGVTVNVFYNRFGVSNKVLQEATDMKIDHWQFYGIAAGPSLQLKLVPRAKLDLSVLGGVANVNSPKVDYKGQTVFKEDWNAAALFGAGASIRVNVASNVLLLVNADYKYMRPEFKVGIPGETPENVKQHMGVCNLTAGIGIGF